MPPDPLGLPWFKYGSQYGTFLSTDTAVQKQGNNTFEIGIEICVPTQK